MVRAARHQPRLYKAFLGAALTPSQLTKAATVTNVVLLCQKSCLYRPALTRGCESAHISCYSCSL